jgi:hypothetical protein
MFSFTDHDLTERLVAREELVERFQLAQSGRLERSTHMFVNKQFEPIPQRTRLRRNAVKFAWDGALLRSGQHIARHQSSLFEPRE